MDVQSEPPDLSKVEFATLGYSDAFVNAGSTPAVTRNLTIESDPLDAASFVPGGASITFESHSHNSGAIHTIFDNCGANLEGGRNGIYKNTTDSLRHVSPLNAYTGSIVVGPECSVNLYRPGDYKLDLPYDVKYTRVVHLREWNIKI